MAVNLHTTHYRFGINELAENTHGWHANEDANPAQGVIVNDTIFLLRFCVQETGGTAAANVDNQFQYRLNAGAFTNITTTSSVVKAVNGILTDGSNCTQRLSGTGTFESSGAGQTEDGLSGGNANDLAANGNSETECCLQIVGADVAHGDVIEFRLTSPDFTVTNDVVPTLTVNKPQTLTLSGIGSGEGFGTALLRQTIAPSGIASMEAFGSATVSAPAAGQTLTPSGIASAQAFGTLLLRHTKITESWNAADSASLNADHPWNEPVGGNWRILNNHATLNTGSAGQNAAYITDAVLADGYEFVRGLLPSFTGETGTAAAWGVMLRMPGTSELTGYVMRAVANGPTDLFWDIIKVVNSVELGQLASSAQDPAALDSFTLAIRTLGNGDVELRGWVNKVPLLSGTDPVANSPVTSSNRHVGVWGYYIINAGTANGGLESFIAGIWQLLSPSGLASAEAFGSATLSVSAGGQTISPSGISSAEAFGASALHQAIAPAGISSAEAFGSTTVSTGGATQTLELSGIASGEAIGTAQVNQTVSPSGIPSAEAIGTVALRLTLTSSGITSAEAFGTPSAHQTLNPSGIPSSETVGSLVLTQDGGALTLIPSGMASGEAFGTGQLNHLMRPTALASGEAFGATRLQMTITASGVPTAEAFGALGLRGTLSPSGVPSNEAFGATVLTTGPVTLAPTGIPSAEAFGTVVFFQGTIPVVVQLVNIRGSIPTLTGITGAVPTLHALRGAQPTIEDLTGVS